MQLISSHTYVVDRPGTFGVRAGLSQLVSNMLESVCHMWKLHASPESVRFALSDTSLFCVLIFIMFMGFWFYSV